MCSANGIFAFHQLCMKTIPLRNPASETHLENCRPYCPTYYFRGPCSRWFFGLFRRHQPGRACICHRPPTNSSRCQPAKKSRDATMPTTTTIRKAKILGNKTQRKICGLCFALGDMAALTFRESREKDEIEHLAQQQLRCVICTREVRHNDLKWWGCRLCQKECLSSFHPS